MSCLIAECGNWCAHIQWCYSRLGWTAGTRYCGDLYRTESGSKCHHQRKMAGAISVLFWLHFCIVDGSGDTLSIFCIVSLQWIYKLKPVTVRRDG